MCVACLVRWCSVIWVFWQVHKMELNAHEQACTTSRKKNTAAKNKLQEVHTTNGNLHFEHLLQIPKIHLIFCVRCARVFMSVSFSPIVAHFFICSCLDGVCFGRFLAVTSLRYVLTQFVELIHVFCVSKLQIFLGIVVAVVVVAVARRTNLYITYIPSKSQRLFFIAFWIDGRIFLNRVYMKCFLCFYDHFHRRCDRSFRYIFHLSHFRFIFRDNFPTALQVKTK